MTAATVPTSRARTIVLWVLRVLMAALFLSFGFMKLASYPMAIHDFDAVGLGQWLRYFTGLLELAGGVAVLVPSVSAFGAILLLLVAIGAFVAQVSVLHRDWIHTIVVALILGAIIYHQRDLVRSRLGL